GAAEGWQGAGPRLPRRPGDEGDGRQGEPAGRAGAAARGAVLKTETAAVAGFLFVLYALGACPTIYVGDSGELVTAVHLLGIPHPTGYPLYVLLGKLWTFALPFRSVAWRMSLFSAAAAAAACALLYRLARSNGLGPIAALFAALLLAVSPSFWGEAT